MAASKPQLIHQELALFGATSVPTTRQPLRLAIARRCTHGTSSLRSPRCHRFRCAVHPAGAKYAVMPVRPGRTEWQGRGAGVTLSPGSNPARPVHRSQCSTKSSDASRGQSPCLRPGRASLRRAYWWDVGLAFIHPATHGRSRDRYSLRTSTWPSWGSPTGTCFLVSEVSRVAGTDRAWRAEIGGWSGRGHGKDSLEMEHGDRPSVAEGQVCGASECPAIGLIDNQPVRFITAIRGATGLLIVS